jgi:hypothetical protein
VLTDRQPAITYNRDDKGIILTYAVLIGLTPLIPIPLVDDWLKNVFRKQLVRKLAWCQSLTLSPAEVDALAQEPDAWVKGCLYGVLIYPILIISRKVFFILEWRRAVDVLSHNYYYGYLLNYAFKMKFYPPGDVGRAAWLNAGVERAHRGANTTTFKKMVRQGFNNSRDLVRAAVIELAASLRSLNLTLGQRLGQLTRRLPFVRRKAAPPPQVKEVEAEAEKLVETPGLRQLAARIQAEINHLPAEHFAALEERLLAELRRGSQ